MQGGNLGDLGLAEPDDEQAGFCGAALHLHLFACFVFDFIGKLLKLIALLAALGLIEGLPWIAIGFCIALGFALFHMI